FFFFGFYFLLSFVLYIKYLLLIHYHTKECIIMQLFDVLNVINILIVVFCACLSKG
ncbi:putative membrane protein, partial [Escherichia coli 5.2239]